MTDWRERALCRRRDERLYWLESIPNAAKQAHAKAVCYGCPVKRECAQDAYDMNDVGVVRAGIALPGSPVAGIRTMLLYVAEHGDLPDEGNDENLEKDRATQEMWHDRRCKDCHVALRPKGAAAEFWPGTSASSAKDQCQSCWRRIKKERQWQTGK